MQGKDCPKLFGRVSLGDNCMNREEAMRGECLHERHLIFLPSVGEFIPFLKG